MGLSALASAAVLGVVEGVTEFLPVSSTGHLIITGDLLGYSGEKAKTFEIFIQLGAILAVVWLYRSRLATLARDAGRELVWVFRTRGASSMQDVGRERDSLRLLLNLAIAFLPAALVGLLAHDFIKQHLFSPLIVAIATLIGGVLILAIERWAPASHVNTVAAVTPLAALGVGLAQVLSLIPGTSRSGATILGGYCLGLSRLAATEFSFFLAIPVMFAATLFDLIKSREALSAAALPEFAVGFVVSYVTAVIIVRSFLGYVARHTFKPFAWYRIGFGALLIWYYLGRAA